MFKYDLVMHIMQSGLVGRFTYIPLLTAPDASGQGGQTDRRRAQAGINNTELMAFLDGCIRESRRDVPEISAFFTGKGIEIAIYRDKFAHRRRREYFARIDDGLLSGSLVLVDPDVGLEIKRPDEKHVLYSEIEDLYQRMGDSSALMLSQHLPRLPRQDYLNRRCTELKEKVSGDYPVCIDDGAVAFFFLTRDEHLEHGLTHAIGHYAEIYGED